MPLVNFVQDGRARLGKLFGDRIVDLSIAAPDLPAAIIEFLEAGDAAVAAFKAVDDDRLASLPLKDVRLLPPVPRPGKFLGIGMNYRDHAAEASKAGLETPPSSYGSTSRSPASRARSTTS